MYLHYISTNYFSFIHFVFFVLEKCKTINPLSSQKNVAGFPVADWASGHSHAQPPSRNLPVGTACRGVPKTSYICFSAKRQNGKTANRTTLLRISGLPFCRFAGFAGLHFSLRVLIRFTIRQVLLEPGTLEKTHRGFCKGSEGVLMVNDHTSRVLVV